MGDYHDAVREFEVSVKISKHGAHFDYYSLLLGYWGVSKTRQAMENHQLAAERGWAGNLDYSTLQRWRRGRESNPRIGVLQTPALPLGYPAAKERGLLGESRATVNGQSAPVNRP
jgi:hypothetical protein